jgi:predicted aconitase
MEPDFERELGWGRKASKWDVDYEIFDSRDYKKAILRAYEATEDGMKDKTNLEMLEQKSIEKEQLTDKQQTLKAAQDPIKLIYDWIKQGHVSLKEAKTLIAEVTNNG